MTTPIERRIARRRPEASASAAPKRSSGTTQSQLPSVFRSFVRSWALSSWFASMILDPRAVLGELRGKPGKDRDSVAELDQERAEVEEHGALVGLDAPDVVFEHGDQLLVGERDRIDPTLLGLWSVEHPNRAAIGELAQGGTERAGEPLLVGGELLLELGGDVDVREQLVDERRSDLVADLLVLDQQGRRLSDGRRVERLEADISRQQAPDQEQGSEKDQHAGAEHAAARGGAVGHVFDGRANGEGCLHPVWVTVSWCRSGEAALNSPSEGG